MSATRPWLFRPSEGHKKESSGLTLSRRAQYLWIRAQIRAPVLLQDRIVPALHGAKEVARLLVRPRLPVDRLEGLGQGGPLSVHYAGFAFARTFVEGLFFAAKPAARRLGAVPFWQRAALTQTDADVAIVASTGWLIRGLPRRNALVLPEFVHHELDLTGDWQGVQRRFHSSVRRDQRLARRYDYQYELSHDRRDLETFYHQMYLPTVSNRYGEQGSPMPLGEAYEYLDRGMLFMVTRDGQWVSGSLCYAKQGVLRFMIMGVLNGDQELIKEGAVGAMNCLRLQWAHQSGYRAVNFLGTNPYLDDGLFQYKRKWGTAVRVPPSLHRRIWLQVRQVTPAVADWLKLHPLIVLDEDHALHGLITVDDVAQVTAEMRNEWTKHYMTPGLKSLLVYTVDQFAAGEVGTAPPQLILPIEPAGSDS